MLIAASRRLADRGARGIQVAHQALLPIIVWLNVRIIFGQAHRAQSLVPIGLLYSAIPVWHVFVPALQAMTISVVSALLRIVAIPAYVDGRFRHTSAAASFMSRMAARACTISSSPRRSRRCTANCAATAGRVRVYLFGLAIALALVSNWLRVFIIIVAGDLTDMQHYLVRVDHSTFGWVVFAVAMVVFLLLVQRWPVPARIHHASRGSDSVRGDALASIAAHAAAVAALASRSAPPGCCCAGPGRRGSQRRHSRRDRRAGSGPAESCHGRWRPQYRTPPICTRSASSRAAARSVCFYSATFCRSTRTRN